MKATGHFFLTHDQAKKRTTFGGGAYSPRSLAGEHFTPLRTHEQHLWSEANAAPLAIFDSTAAEEDFGATPADTPDEAGADGDKSDHPISNWEVKPRAKAASDNGMESGIQLLRMESGL
ncbi:hypothetical protein PsorP6_013887 [Peronosclerospora sorghi]|uniref:Uncharacterized protein n=1 Tax=Peronosclerospora sorghi TaxID=230839 RepID=A0ACC0VFN6_9STRA|nr:hypothetical protein PsorP6_013887 [Peronosclerospora sorghi]